MMITALTKAPAPTLTDHELTYLTRDPLDFALAQRQHQLYCAALRRHGAQVITLPADEAGLTCLSLIFAMNG
jgi:dimethylargininase